MIILYTRRRGHDVFQSEKDGVCGEYRDLAVGVWTDGATSASPLEWKRENEAVPLMNGCRKRIKSFIWGRLPERIKSLRRSR
jgi:hypothetical protein